MPRRRMIDPEIWRNEKIGSLSDAGRLLFIGIFSQADDDGRLKASPRYLMASIFPYDKDKNENDIKRLRDQCAELGLIRLYTNGKEEYLDIPGWLEHQQIRKDRYSPSALPSFDNSEPTTIGKPSGNHLATNDQPNIIKSSLVKSNHETLPNGKVGGEPPESTELFDLWNSLGVIKHKKLTGDMTRAIKAASRDFSAAEISQAMRNYAQIVNDEECYFNYRWTMKDFLKRGLDKFLDLEVALKNYRKGGESGEYRRHPEEHKPENKYEWEETPDEPDDTS